MIVDVFWVDWYMSIATYQFDLENYPGTVKIRREVLDLETGYRWAVVILLINVSPHRSSSL